MYLLMIMILQFVYLFASAASATVSAADNDHHHYLLYCTILHHLVQKYVVHTSRVCTMCHCHIFKVVEPWGWDFGIRISKKNWKSQTLLSGGFLKPEHWVHNMDFDFQQHTNMIHDKILTNNQLNYQWTIISETTLFNYHYRYKQSVPLTHYQYILVFILSISWWHYSNSISSTILPTH